MSQEVRDAVGTKLLKLTLKELFLWRYMQTDPNWWGRRDSLRGCMPPPGGYGGCQTGGCAQPGSAAPVPHGSLCPLTAPTSSASPSVPDSIVDPAERCVVPAPANHPCAGATSCLTPPPGRST